MAAPILEAQGLVKRYANIVRRREAFRPEADLQMPEPATVGVMGPNGSGRTTLFERITGSNRPSAGTVRVMGQNMYALKYHERDRLAIRYHQSCQVRRFRRIRPSFLMESAGRDEPMVHLFDEPQFHLKDGYMGFMLDFFRKLRAEGRPVFVCLHPNEPYHLELMREVCERFLFVLSGQVSGYADCGRALEAPHVRAYLGYLAPGAD